MSRRTFQILWRAVLWALGALLLWLAAAHLLVAWMSPSGRWQLPRLRAVKVMRPQTDPTDGFTDPVLVTHGPEEKLLRMLKGERKALEVDEEIWVVDNPFVNAIRPAQYRATPVRLGLIFGPLLLPLLLVLLWKAHRHPLDDPEAAPRDEGFPRRALTDDFHQRAERRVPSEAGEGRRDP